VFGVQRSHLHSRAERSDATTKRRESPGGAGLGARIAGPFYASRSGRLGPSAIRICFGARAGGFSCAGAADSSRSSSAAYCGCSAGAAAPCRGSSGPAAEAGIDRAVFGDGHGDASFAFDRTAGIHSASYASFRSPAVTGRPCAIGAAFRATFNIVGAVGAAVCTIGSPLETCCRSTAASPGAELIARDG
jgi:hypothetical protein